MRRRKILECYVNYGYLLVSLGLNKVRCCIEFYYDMI